MELEVSRSEEDDYLSYGFALSDAWELNQKNTVISYGLNYLDDTVSVPVLGDRKKNTYDLFAGVTQIIDKNTLITANLTLGYSEGYLNDPYKVIQRNEVLDPGGLNVPLINVYRENRPDSRFRQVLQFEGKRYFEHANGALEAVVRFSHDDFGILSETLQLEWRQEVGEHFEVIPFARYYHQNAADFFMNTLNGMRFPTPSRTIRAARLRPTRTAAARTIPRTTGSPPWMPSASACAFATSSTSTSPSTPPTSAT